ncbi:MAG: hypothetical protein LBQ97_09390 [Fusobacteriaceae bacterium]|nr:hypothetical protein [Fusobacteriaceae bacterium]
MSLLDELADETRWLEFLSAKKEKRRLPEKELDVLAQYIQEKTWGPVVETIRNGGSFGLAEKKLLNKLGSDKKRVVYCYSDAETPVLKLLATLLYRYDHRQPEGCYSFRAGYGAHRAIHMLTRRDDPGAFWCYKSDIHDYFNCIPVPQLLPILGDVTGDDPQLYNFIAGLLTQAHVLWKGKPVAEQRGVMAGIPVAPFLANLYLRELDAYFTERKILYARYSDDLMFFAPTEEELLDHKDVIHEILTRHGLRVNPRKEKTYRPGESREFLGVSWDHENIDLSAATREKLKGKIRRKAHALVRWQQKKSLPPEKAIAVMIRTFNRKFFEGGDPDELTWSRWFFPLLTTDKGLREMDQYLQQYLRYFETGRHCKKNYAIRYGTLKELGYRSLVHEWHRFKEGGIEEFLHAPSSSVISSSCS